VTIADRLLGAALAAAALAAVVSGSNASLTAHPTADAMLRLAWSALPERVETCREATAEELARLPPHMRQRLVCEGSAASYRLTVRAGGAVVADRVVRAGGLRHDRRLYVFQEIRIPAAETAVEVRFDRIEAAAATAAPAASPSGRAVPPSGSRESIPPRLAFVDRLPVEPRSVVLITYDPGRRALIAVSAR
jgi:hypothetical protein